MIPYSTQCIDEDDIEAVADVLRSPFLTAGPMVPRFEEALCEVTGAPYAVAVSSATAGLHLTLQALGIGEGDTVLVSAISFASSANCARMVGAAVDFVDVDPLSGLITPETLAAKLKACQAAGQRVRAVIAVDLAGRMTCLEKLAALREEYGFYLIEDAAHALGACRRGHNCGDGACADATVFSFHPVKIITTAEGGAVMVRDKELHRRLTLLRSHGIEHDRAYLEDQNRPAYYYEMQTLGFNYRMSDVHAALGLAQLDKLESFLSKRRSLAKAYPAYLKEILPLGLTLPEADSEDNLSSWHLYQVGIPERDRVYRFLRDRGIGVQVHYLPIYRHPYYQSLKAYPPLEGAEHFFEHTLSLPLHPQLNTVTLSYVSSLINEALEKAEEDA